MEGEEGVEEEEEVGVGDEDDDGEEEEGEVEEVLAGRRRDGHSGDGP